MKKITLIFLFITFNSTFNLFSNSALYVFRGDNIVKGYVNDISFYHLPDQKIPNDAYLSINSLPTVGIYNNKFATLSVELYHIDPVTKVKTVVPPHAIHDYFYTEINKDQETVSILGLDDFFNINTRLLNYPLKTFYYNLSQFKKETSLVFEVTHKVGSWDSRWVPTYHEKFNFTIYPI